MTEDQCDSKKSADLCVLCSCGALWDTVEAYLCECRAGGEDMQRKGKPVSRFPNLAGLCRFAGVGVSRLRSLEEEYPEEYDRLLAVFEDEALNADLSPTLVSSYMKKRLLYAEESKAGKERGEVSYCFEHDIYADGE